MEVEMFRLLATQQLPTLSYLRCHNSSFRSVHKVVIQLRKSDSFRNGTFSTYRFEPSNVHSSNHPPVPNLMDKIVFSIDCLDVLSPVKAYRPTNILRLYFAPSLRWKYAPRSLFNFRIQ